MITLPCATKEVYLEEPILMHRNIFLPILLFSITFLCKIFWQSLKAGLNFHLCMNRTCPLSSRSNLLYPVAYEANYVVFQLFYAHTTHWETVLEGSYKLTPPVF